MGNLSNLIKLNKKHCQRKHNIAELNFEPINFNAGIALIQRHPTIHKSVQNN
jgi:hypothetical protein